MSMGPAAYRALEVLAAAGQAVPVADRPVHRPGYLHPGPAGALARRGLARQVYADGRTYLAITSNGADLLARNPAPRGTT